ncbi:PBP superfamily domain protein [uncultured archaeon]|nr:PBP superfamily domain protein [uncultured archaeon]
MYIFSSCLSPVNSLRKLLSALLIALLIGAMGTAIVMAKETVRVSGSTTVLPLAQAGAEAFNAVPSDYEVLVSGGGTGVGINDVAAGNSQIGMASREVTAEEKSKFGDKFGENLVGYDGIVIAVSKPIYDAGVTTLSKDQVKKIYSGEINNWKDLKGPDEPILVVAREAGSGTRDTFNEEIMGSKAAETAGVNTVTNSNAEVRTAIVGSNKAIGYLGFSYAEDGSVGVITLDGIKPTKETIKEGSYELNRKLYFYTFGDVMPGAKAFIDFMTGSEGRKIAEENGFVAL